MSADLLIMSGGSSSGGASTWDTLQNAVANLTLANAGFTTTFNQTSGVTWKWANTTAATSSVNNLSPVLQLLSDIWSNGADTASGFSIQSKISASPNNKTITNSSENSSNVVTLTVGSSHGFVALQRVTFTGLTTATWLNGVTVIITSVAATTITFTDPTSHGTSASHADTGTATQVPTQEFTIGSIGTTGDARVILPILGAANGNVGCGGFAFAGQSALIGYGPISLTTGGLACYTGSSGGSSTAVFSIYEQNTVPASNAPTRVIASWEYGDNSDGNSTSLITAAASGFSVGLQGSRTTAAQTSNPCVLLGNSNNTLINTSNTMIGLGIGYSKGITNAFNFAPTSGTGVFICTDVRYTINQTGGANGNSTGLKVTATETAVGGTHKLMDLFAGSAGTTEIFSIDNSGQTTELSANGAQWIHGQASELLTLSTSGTTTDTAGNLLPADAIIEAVVARVTTTITTATDWKLGDATTAGRFSGANSTMTAGTTQVGTVQADQTGSAGPRQTAAAKVRVTTTGTPGAGAIRITVFYRKFVAPTS